VIGVVAKSKRSWGTPRIVGKTTFEGVEAKSIWSSTSTQVFMDGQGSRSCYYVIWRRDEFVTMEE
jgi:hypothetical protein